MTDDIENDQIECAYAAAHILYIGCGTDIEKAKAALDKWKNTKDAKGLAIDLFVTAFSDALGAIEDGHWELPKNS